MASSAGGIGEAEAAAGTTNRRTIYDYLGEGEDGEVVASPPSPETPPRLRLPRFTCARIRFGGLGRKRGGRKEGAAAADKNDHTSPDSSGWDQAAESRGVAGGGGVAAAHTTGMGLSMLLLLARTCVELNRMAEVRAQMEALLKEMRDEASRVKGAAADHDVVVAAPGTCHGGPQSSSTTTASSSCVVSDTSTTLCLELETVGSREGDQRASSPEDEGYRTGVREVEAEAEAEAGHGTEHSRRRQAPECKCDAEQETPECSVQSSSSDDDEFIELQGGRFGAGGSSSSQPSQRGAADDDDYDGSGVDDGSCEKRRRGEGGGVSAAELERRLHELQHRRDRERIAALEAALRRARRKLTEKEMEARLWQDTAALALGRPATRDDGGQ
ncbi:hypothetical protein U9M48_025467 [Paspalum notatum var. saurae]|uniref:Protein POLAR LOCALIZATION DURING ASYMMETRIC DIVISION AND REDISTRIBUTION n=1 Tax=Paspalum notatum var. saurae TaxID=547442 RepID=A0AAQ3TSK2_PASNO